LWPVLLVGLYSGFGSTLIDPARPQQAGVWLWLRVPVLAFLLVGGIILVAALLTLGIMAGVSPGGTAGQNLAVAGGMALFATGCGMVAFLRSGGFNGVQHFLLRWQLVRSGHLPSRPEAFLNYATQLALLQRVGLGYRFVHALLLQHLAPGEGSAGRDPAGETGPPRVGQRIRLAGLMGLMAGLGLFISMGLAAGALRALGDTFQPWNVATVFFGSCMLTVAAMIPFWLLSGRWLTRLSWAWLGAAYAGVALLTGWLAWDEVPVRPPRTITALVPAFPGAEQSHAVLKRYYIDQHAGRNFKWRGLNFVHTPKDEAVWLVFLGKRRIEIEANWAALAPVRAWLDELNTFARIGDLDEFPLARTTISYQLLRAYTQNAMAVAGLRALDGQGDVAILGLLPMLEVGAKLEVGARGVSNYEIGRLLQDSAILAADYVLRTAPVSGPVRDRLAAALASRGAPEGVRRAYALQQIGVTEASETGNGVFLQGGGWLRPVVFNRQTVLNRWDQFFADLEELAVRRDSAGTTRRVAEFMAAQKQNYFKNVGGAWFSWIVEWRLNLKKSGERVVERYWATEDRRAALLQRLGEK
jgi:hypothetical protein